jgi:ABC-type uncharacterized transport system ATPase subunit
MAKNTILEVEQLTKRYDQYLAVDHISFSIEEGEILGLLGPNGAMYSRSRKTGEFARLSS